MPDTDLINVPIDAPHQPVEAPSAGRSPEKLFEEQLETAIHTPSISEPTDDEWAAEDHGSSSMAAHYSLIDVPSDVFLLGPQKIIAPGQPVEAPTPLSEASTPSQAGAALRSYDDLSPEEQREADEQMRQEFYAQFASEPRDPNESILDGTHEMYKDIEEQNIADFEREYNARTAEAPKYEVINQQSDNTDSREPIAVRLTEEQTKLLLSAEYPNNTQQQTTALYNVYSGNEHVNVMNESVALNYSEDQKSFFATLDKDEKPAIDAKLTQLQAEKERAKPKPESAKQPPERRRQRDIERD